MSHDIPILPVNLFTQGRSVEDFTLDELQQMISYSRFEIDQLTNYPEQYNYPHSFIPINKWKEYLSVLEAELESRVLLS